MPQTDSIPQFASMPTSILKVVTHIHYNPKTSPAYALKNLKGYAKAAAGGYVEIDEALQILRLTEKAFKPKPQAPNPKWFKPAARETLLIENPIDRALALIPPTLEMGPFKYLRLSDPATPAWDYAMGRLHPDTEPVCLGDIDAVAVRRHVQAIMALPELLSRKRPAVEFLCSLWCSHFAHVPSGLPAFPSNDRMGPPPKPKAITPVSPPLPAREPVFRRWDRPHHDPGTGESLPLDALLPHPEKIGPGFEGITATAWNKAAWNLARNIQIAEFEPYDHIDPDSVRYHIKSLLELAITKSEKSTATHWLLAQWLPSITVKGKKIVAPGTLDSVRL